MAGPFSLFKSLATRAARPDYRLRHQRRLVLETLENRLALTTFIVPAGDIANTGDSSTDTGGLVWAIDQANAAGGANTISLASGATYDFTTADNYWYGPNALPAISSTIVVQGNEATLQRDSSLAQTTADSFRFFYVSGGLSGLAAGNLTLENLTLENGLAKGGDSDQGGGGLGAGGAIFNQGNLTLDTVTLSGNEALGGNSGVIGLGAGGGGLGQDAPANGNGGGFGGPFPGAAGGAGGAGAINGGGGGGGGFSASGANATSDNGGAGGGLSGLGGIGGSPSSSAAPAGDGGGGATGATGGSGLGSAGGGFGFGGIVSNNGAAGGGGVGGGGGSGVVGDSPGGSQVGGGGGFGGGGGATLGAFATPIEFITASGLTGTTTVQPLVTPVALSNYPAGGGGGFGAGNGADGGGGGAGDGMGGAVFSMYGTVTSLDSTFIGNSAKGGNSSGPAGSAYGGGLLNLDGIMTFIGGSIDATNVAAGGSGDQYSVSSGNAIFNYDYGNNIDGSTAHATLFLDSTANVAGDASGGGVNAQIDPISGDQLGTVLYVAQSSPPSAGQVVFDVVFSAPVTGFSAAGVVLSGTAPGETAAVTGSGADYTVTVSGMTGSGLVSALIPAGAAQDSEGDKSQVSNTASQNFYDFEVQGSTLTVNGFAASEEFLVDFTDATHFSVNIGGYIQAYSTAQISTIDYNGSASDNESEVFGAVGTVQAAFSPGAVQVLGQGYTINISQSVDNYVYGTSASTATFAGGTSTAVGAFNIFVGTQAYSYLYGNTLPTSLDGGQGSYENFAAGFGATYGHEATTSDSGWLYSSHDAQIAMTPSYSYLSVGGATAFADGFSNDYAYAAGDGSDAVFMYDSVTVAAPAPGFTLSQSATGVSFVGTPNYSYMSGQFSAGNVPNFFNVSDGFANVYAVAQGTGDIAYLDSSSSSGNDLLAFADGAAGIRGYGYENVIQGFGLVYATGSSGTNSLDVEANPNDAPILQDPNGIPISYSSGNELVPTGFGAASLVLEASQVAALDFVLQQLGSYQVNPVYYYSYPIDPIVTFS